MVHSASVKMFNWNEVFNFLVLFLRLLLSWLSYLAVDRLWQILSNYYFDINGFDAGLKFGLCLLLITALLVGWWIEESVVTWARINDWESKWGSFLPRDIEAWRPREMDICTEGHWRPFATARVWYSESFSAVGEKLFEKFLYYEWSLIYWYFGVFCLLRGCPWLRKIKKKLQRNVPHLKFSLVFSVKV